MSHHWGGHDAKACGLHRRLNPLIGIPERLMGRWVSLASSRLSQRHWMWGDALYAAAVGTAVRVVHSQTSDPTSACPASASGPYRRA